jgi:hypothetical protein
MYRYFYILRNLLFARVIFIIKNLINYEYDTKSCILYPTKNRKPTGTGQGDLILFLQIAVQYSSVDSSVVDMGSNVAGVGGGGTNNLFPREANTVFSQSNVRKMKGKPRYIYV